MSIKTLPLLLASTFIGLTISGCDRVYVVAPNGSDNNRGTFMNPFKTIQKCASVVQAGETCLLRKGIYRETVQPQFSGTPAKPITFQAYNNENVTVSGADPVLGWKPYRDAIFQTNVTLPIDNYQDEGFLANQIFVNGKMMTEARWPNNEAHDPMLPKLAECCIKSPVGLDATIENSEIPNLPEGWAGASIWSNEWYGSRTGTVTGGSEENLTAVMTAPWERGGYYFSLFGRLGLLDSEGEWFYDSQNHTLYLWGLKGVEPKSVEAKQRNLAFDLSNRSYIVLNNLKIFASTITTNEKSQGVVIDRVQAKYVSHHMTLPPLPQSEQAPGSDDALLVASHAHDTGIQLRGRGHTLKNSIIEWSSGNGVLLEGTGHIVTNNIIANSNYLVSQAAPVRINGSSHQITHNTITRTSAAAIQIDWHTAGLEAKNVEIAYNDLSHFGMRITDVGAIGICCRVNIEGGSIHHNWIRDAEGYSPFWGTRGIYLDLESFNSTIHHNVVWNLTGGSDNYNFLVSSPRGYERVFNNTFLGEVAMSQGLIEARNNIFAVSPNIDSVPHQSNNFFNNVDPLFVQPPTPELKRMPNFNLKANSLAVDAGVVIPKITEEYKGKAPDIGAYERGGENWQAGSNLKYNFKEK